MHVPPPLFTLNINPSCIQPRPMWCQGGETAGWLYVEGVRMVDSARHAKRQAYRDHAT